jgi:hypothetical protein
MDWNNEERWMNWADELHRCLVRYRAQDAEEYKPTMIERIICYIKFKQLTRRNHVFQNKSL